MPHILDYIKQTTHKFYNWTLGEWVMFGGHAPELTMTPNEPWPGQAPQGRWICQGIIHFRQDSLTIDPAQIETGHFWQDDSISAPFHDYLHSFDWLRDLKTYGGEAARQQSRRLIKSWIETYPSWSSSKSWQLDILGRRIANWIAHFDFAYANCDDHEYYSLLASIQRQAKHLSRALATTSLHGPALLYAAKGLCYAGLSMEERENWLEQGIDIIKTQIPAQILSDGGHISRNPQSALDTLRLCLDINAALAQGGYARLDILQHAIDKITPAIRFFRHGDKGLSCFHQCDEGNAADIDAILAQVDGKIRIPKSLNHSGYERLTAGRSTLIMDCGASDIANRPYDQTIHASPLAFEFSHGRDRIFVNCANHNADHRTQALLRCSAAHNMLVIDDRNAHEIRADGHIGKRRYTPQINRYDSQDLAPNNGTIIDAQHDGYAPLFGLNHRRRIFLSQNGCDLRGQDMLIGQPFYHQVQAQDQSQHHADASSDPSMVNLPLAIRFHLHPRVMVSMIQQGRECLLRTQNGQGWRFFYEGGDMRLENSVYFGDQGDIRKTKQIVIHASIPATKTTPPTQWTIQWALEKT